MCVCELERVCVCASMHVCVWVLARAHVCVCVYVWADISIDLNGYLITQYASNIGIPW